jgi:hypothetical protein
MDDCRRRLRRDAVGAGSALHMSALDGLRGRRSGAGWVRFVCSGTPPGFLNDGMRALREIHGWALPEAPTG